MSSQLTERLRRWHREQHLAKRDHALWKVFVTAEEKDFVPSTLPARWTATRGLEYAPIASAGHDGGESFSRRTTS